MFAKSDYQIRSAVRNTAILELLFATGARVAEICTLRSDNVDLLGNSVKFYGKGSKERIIPIENFAVLSILRKYHSLFEKEIRIRDIFRQQARQKNDRTVCSQYDKFLLQTVRSRYAYNAPYVPTFFCYSSSRRRC